MTDTMPIPRPRVCSGSMLGKDGKPWIKTCTCHYGQPVEVRPALRAVTA